jgi:hypothetical protein
MSPSYVIVTFREVRRMSNFAQIGIQYAYGQIHAYARVEGSPVKIKSPTH